MVYTILSIIRYSGTRQHNVSETGPNRVGVSPSHLRTETDPVSETLYFLVSRIPDDGQSPKTQ
jgi:hypothetical protein